MNKIHFAGIRRGSIFSPNHTGNDNAIFDGTTTWLQNHGCKVSIYTEKEFCEQAIDVDFIFGMPRDKRTVQAVQGYELMGIPAVNSGFGIEKCYRSNMTRGLLGKGVPYPQSYIVDTVEDSHDAFEKLGGRHFWIKRGDFHAIHKEDVTFAHSPAEGDMVLKEYALRGIKEAVISEHLPGDLIKFYGVRGTSFYYWFYPFDFNHSKFGNESINGEAHYFSFSEQSLKDISNKAATALDVFIYGGDAIVASDGSIRIIDLNDWPSFAPCRDEAASHIAQSIHEHAMHKLNLSYAAD